jgi:hypothetical protein
MTYKTFSSAQEIFDYVTPLLFAQGQRSMLPSQFPDDEDGEPTCAYRGEGGLRCAIGHIIPDELYNPNIEGEGVGGTVLQSVLKEIIPSKYGVTYAGLGKFLGDLQDVHDGWICNGVDGNTAHFNLYNDLLGLADGYGLDETVLYEFNPSKHPITPNNN